MPDDKRPGWGAMLPRYNIPETFGAAISYEGQLHWFLENWNEVAEYASALKQPTVTAGVAYGIDDNSASPTVENSGDSINAVFDFGMPLIYTRFADPLEWSPDRQYAKLTVVGDGNGNSYTSRRDVPAGVELTNSDYWASTGNFDAYLHNIEVEADYLMGRAMRTFPDVNAMQQDDDLRLGVVCLTLGRASAGDGGGAVYVIGTAVAANGLDIIDVASGTMRASMLIDHWVCPAALGGTDSSDSSDAFQRIIDLGAGIDGQGKTYLLTSKLTPPSDRLLMSDCRIDFGGVCDGLFARESNDFYAPTSVFTDSVNIQGCEFFGAVDIVPASTSSRSYSAALPLYCATAVIKDCDIHDNGCNGLILYTDLSNQEAFSDVSIESCRAYNNGVYDTQLRKTGIGIGAYITANSIASNVRVVNCAAWKNSNSGFAMHGIGYVEYVGCVSWENKEHGYVFQTNRGGLASACVARNNSSRAFRIQGDWSSAEGSYCRNIVIDGCVSARGRAINIGGGVRNVLVKDCVLNVGDASRFAVNFDPKDYPDGNIIFDGNMINVDVTEVTPNPRLVEGHCAVDRNVRFTNTMFNATMYPIKGYTIRSEEIPVTSELVQYKPEWPGKQYVDYTDSLTVSAGSLDGHVFTSNSSSGAVRKDIAIGDSGLLSFYVEATPLELASPDVGTGYSRFNIRTANNEYIADLALASTVQESTLTNIRGVWCNVLDLNELRKAYPTAGIVRAFFYVPHAGDVVEINEFSACLV